ncbi:MAG TPA: choice-of-anchor J domain-containing protein, partial [Tenuifilaceae bacterium]|nr:choice-of-anchor J domain-containing protein [Tenuifilaceae bacterium]HPE19446.1 choice-of-anchor J domain-containing protein [Tenuifilaceae bacterium]HPQ34254.1 choice-of-anchor J domain-containing protein [Tenuifilaceae bacterium]HRX69284.1 choice-of-anchor J domain-containing protein [Tenuifilaceae bacterium]
YYTSSQSAGINGYNSGELEEDWLILPGVTLNNDDVALKFDSWRKYGEDDASNYLKVMYSTDYEGIRDPSDATWTELTFSGPSEEETWTTSGNIDLSEIVGDPVYIAIKYHYNVDMYVNWQIDNIYIGEPTINNQAEITSFVLSEQVGDAVINSEAATVNVQVAMGTDLTNLTPTIGVSSGATIAPASGESQDFSEPVDYVVTAEDQTTEKTWTVTVSIESVTSIYEIQYTTDQSGNSPYIDQTVTTSGVVTAVLASGFFIQDSAKAWNGLQIYTTNYTPNIGDKVVVTGKIIEYYEITEMSPVDEYEAISTGNNLPQPVVTTTSGANSEEWESVLIQVLGATCTNADAGYGMAEVNDGSGALKIDDDIFDVVLTQNTKYDITGVGYYSYSEYKLLPRSAEDIEISTSTDVNTKINTRVYPNPFSNSIFVDNIQDASEVTITSLIGQQLMSIPVSGKNVLEIDTNELPAGIYLITIRNENGTRTVKKVVKR